MPQYPIRSHSECFYSLRKSLGIQANSLHSVDINGRLQKNKFIVEIDCEKLLGLSFTGINTKNSLMTVKLKAAEANRANRIHILLFSENIVGLNDTGISVHD